MRADDGIALPLALAVLMVLAVTVTYVLELSASAPRTASRQHADQRAFAAAEAAVETAIGRLAASSDPSVPAALTTGSETIDDDATSAYSASLSGLTWTITGTGSVPSPTDGGAAVTRTVSRQVAITLNATPWEYVFAASPTACMTVRNNALVTTPLYVNGNLCINNDARFTGPKLYVSGTLTMGNTAYVGSAGTPISHATLVGGCTGGVPNPHPCSTSDRVYATVLTQTPSPLPKPPLDLDKAYATARPGPLANCNSGTGIPGNFDVDTVRPPNRNRPLFDLTPAAGYTCQYRDGTGAIVGELSWTGGSPGTLTVSGSVYFDGDIRHAGTAIYQGRGTIYASGKITMAIGATLCGIGGCTSAWDTSNNVLLLVAGSSTDAYGIHLSNNSKFQGALYARTGIYVDNNVVQWGPMVADTIYFDNNSDHYKALIRLTPNAPGIDKTVQPILGAWRG